MPSRIIKESICTSDNLNGISQGAEVFFYRLMVQCDDYGRLDARLPILRARCFPLRSVTDAELTDWLKELSSADLIQLYTVDGRPYLEFKTWLKHQQRRAKHSKYPSLLADDSNCNQMQSSDSTSTRGIEESRKRGIEESRKREGGGADAPAHAKSAVIVWKEVTGQNVPVRLHEMVSDALTLCPDRDRLKEVFTAWIARGYKAANIAGILEWYKTGVPKRASGNGRTKSAHEIVAEELRKMNDGD